MGFDDEGASDNVTIPAGELEAVRAPSEVRTHDDDLAVVDGIGSFGRRWRQHQLVDLHQAIDALGVDWNSAVLPEFPVDERSDASVAVTRPLGHQGVRIGTRPRVLCLVIAPTRLRSGREAIGQRRTGDTEGSGDGLHREASFAATA